MYLFFIIGLPYIVFKNSILAPPLGFLIAFAMFGILWITILAFGIQGSLLRKSLISLREFREKIE
jgi:hypothetical protein